MNIGVLLFFINAYLVIELHYVPVIMTAHVARLPTPTLPRRMLTYKRQSALHHRNELRRTPLDLLCDVSQPLLTWLK